MRMSFGKVLGWSLVVVGLLGAGCSADVGGTVTNEPAVAGESALVRAPDELRALGIEFWRIGQVVDGARTIGLYDARSELRYEVSVGTERDGQTRHAIIDSRTHAREWVNVAQTHDERIKSAVITTSSGGKLEIVIEDAGEPESSAVYVRGRQDWSSRGSPSEGMLRDDESSLFDTHGLAVLRGTLAGLNAQPASGDVGTSQQAMMEAPAIEGGCRVWCARITEILLVYACDGGAVSGCSCSAGSGIFLIEGCTLILPCPLWCSSFYS